jgi:Bacterial extracellular solute-binding proteins, family 3
MLSRSAGRIGRRFNQETWRAARRRFRRSPSLCVRERRAPTCWPWRRDGPTLARDLGVKIEFVDVEDQAVLPRLLATGRIDLAITGIAVTPERAGEMLFSEPNSTSRLPSW